MKKIVTLAAVACMVFGANAETESWSITVVEGETIVLNPDYVANPDASQASVVNFQTPHISGCHVSGPIAGYNDAPELVDGVLEPKYDNSWKPLQTKQLCAEGGDVAPIYYTNGMGNPVDLSKVTFERANPDDDASNFRANWDAAYYQPDGSMGLPSNGTYVKFTASESGTLSVTVWINKGSRRVYVAKGSDCKALDPSTVIASGYINGQNWKDANGEDLPEGDPLRGYPMYQENIPSKGEGADAYVVGMGNQAFWGTLTFAVEAAETYYVFNDNTQIGFGGYVFSNDENGIGEIFASEANVDAPVYNVLGQKVDASYKGIVIKNGVKCVRK